MTTKRGIPYEFEVIIRTSFGAIMSSIVTPPALSLLRIHFYKATKEACSYMLSQPLCHDGGFNGLFPLPYLYLRCKAAGNGVGHPINREKTEKEMKQDEDERQEVRKQPKMLSLYVQDDESGWYH